MRGKELAGEIVKFLNELMELDPSAVVALASRRVSCNEALAQHPTVQVAQAPDGGYEVGLIGLLNGLSGADKDGRGAVAAFVENGKITHFQLLDREVEV